MFAAIRTLSTNTLLTIKTEGEMVGGWVGDLLKGNKLSPPVKVEQSKDFIGGWVGEALKPKPLPKPPAPPSISISPPVVNTPPPQITQTPLPSHDIGNPAITEMFQNPTISDKLKQAMDEAAKNGSVPSSDEFMGGYVGDFFNNIQDQMLKTFEKQMELQREAMRQWVIEMMKAVGLFVLDLGFVASMMAFVYFSYMVMMGSLDAKEKHTQRLYISGMAMLIIRILKAVFFRV